MVGTYYLHLEEHDDATPKEDSAAAPAAVSDEADSPAVETARAGQTPQKRTGSLILFHLEGDNM